MYVCERMCIYICLNLLLVLFMYVRNFLYVRVYLSMYGCMNFCDYSSMYTYSMCVYV